MRTEYNFNSTQIIQYNELSSDKYAILCSAAIYGFIDFGEYVKETI